MPQPRTVSASQGARAQTVEGNWGNLTCAAKGISAFMFRWDFWMAWKLWGHHPCPSGKCSVSPINILVHQAGFWWTQTSVCCLCLIRRGWAPGIRYREGWAETAVSYWDIWKSFDLKKKKLKCWSLWWHCLWSQNLGDRARRIRSSRLASGMSETLSQASIAPKRSYLPLN